MTLEICFSDFLLGLGCRPKKNDKKEVFDCEALGKEQCEEHLKAVREQSAKIKEARILSV